MNLIRTSVFAILLTLGPAHALFAAATTQPTTRPAQSPSPAAVAETFLKGLETLLTTEDKRDRVKANELKTDLTRSVADETVNAIAARYGQSVANLPADKLFEIQQRLVAAWAAVINYYRGHLDYSQIRTLVPILKTADKKLMRVVVPASGPDYPSRSNILVICVKEKNEWKVKLVGLHPAPKTATQPTK